MSPDIPRDCGRECPGQHSHCYVHRKNNSCLRSLAKKVYENEAFMYDNVAKLHWRRNCKVVLLTKCNRFSAFRGHIQDFATGTYDVEYFTNTSVTLYRELCSSAAAGRASNLPPFFFCINTLTRRCIRIDHSIGDDEI